ncbi:MULTISPECIES: hypothetical protein [Pseudofrankia]|uniref:hypothetical protein n=1 Tax=Pseudofrankia TaxID=2994363 RepID=UPI000234CB75|nr:MULTISPECIES: hypothetical protein [Pseudofrankia]
MPALDAVIQSDLPDIADIPLAELRTNDDDALRAGIERILARAIDRDDRLGSASRRLD